MRAWLVLCGLFAIGGCTWETYQDASGQTKLRQKYEAGTRVFYEDGTYARDQRYNNLRPVPHAVKPEVVESGKLPANTNWSAEQE
ncbi:hypothetical protein [Snodgrassella sp. CFCC 13594]|uniref:hypothetical protein n=1 Tax=Snodgrassella sp. CFCC 13594 TaxID=1775559 RepID=UPI0008335E33|nr:hypothetical protein [Snodgrassella sp. CFCC 13594]